MRQLLSSLELLLLLALVGLFHGAQAFVVKFSPKSHHHPPFSKTSRVLSTVEKEPRLSTEEEELLFGSGDDAGSLQRRPLDKFGNILPNSNNRNNNDNNPLDHAEDARINKLHTIRETARSVPELWMRIAEVVPDLRAVYDAHHCDGKLVDLTFQQFSNEIRKSARVFRDLGVSKSTNVAIFAENSAHWLLADQGIQRIGGVTAVRGADAPLDELRYIYNHSDAKLVVLQGPKLIESLIAKDGKIGFSNEKHGDVKTIVLLHRDKFTNDQLNELSHKMGGGVKIHVFADLLEAADPVQELPKLETSDWSTIVYTSGTTGNPKGAILSHGNLLHQTGHRLSPSMPYEEGEPLPGETMVSLLPGMYYTKTLLTHVVLNAVSTVVTNNGWLLS
jgi:long-chain acyl-CoA synthetase